MGSAAVHHPGRFSARHSVAGPRSGSARRSALPPVRLFFESGTVRLPGHNGSGLRGERLLNDLQRLTQKLCRHHQRRQEAQHLAVGRSTMTTGRQPTEPAEQASPCTMMCSRRRLIRDGAARMTLEAVVDCNGSVAALPRARPGLGDEDPSTSGRFTKRTMSTPLDWTYPILLLFGIRSRSGTSARFAGVLRRPARNGAGWTSPTSASRFKMDQRAYRVAVAPPEVSAYISSVARVVTDVRDGTPNCSYRICPRRSSAPYLRRKIAVSWSLPLKLVVWWERTDGTPVQVFRNEGKAKRGSPD